MAGMDAEVKTPAQVGPYTLRGTIGEGSFSVVKLCYHAQEAKYYACKVVPKKRIIANKLEKSFESEIRIDQQLHHPGIVGLIEILQDAANYYLVMEFCPKGELFQYIVDRNKLSEDEAKNLILQIMDAVKYLHSIGVLHRDLKPENILVDQSCHLKISDFGLSKFVGKSCLVSTPCGSPCYASPECISGKPYNGKTNDVWSVGVILFAMVTGQLPWTKRNQAQLFEQIKKGEYTIPHYLSKNCGDLIKKLLTVDCKKRITLDKAMAHPWFADRKPVPAPPIVQKVVSLKKVDEFFCRNASFDSADILPEISRQKSAAAATFDRTLKEIRGSSPTRARSRKATPHQTPSPRKKPSGTKEDTIRALENVRKAALSGTSGIRQPTAKQGLPRTSAASRRQTIQSRGKKC